MFVPAFKELRCSKNRTNKVLFLYAGEISAIAYLLRRKCTAARCSNYTLLSMAPPVTFMNVRMREKYVLRKM